jgi:GT2 family glycosyltransferase
MGSGVAMDVCVVLYRCDASRIAAGLRHQDELHVVDNTDNNIGFAAGANAAAALGHDRLICFANPDGWLTNECLDKLEGAMDDPGVVACEPRLDRPNVEFLPTGDLAWAAGTCLVVRRDAFEQLGGFDERLFMYHEDVDLGHRLRTLGRIVLVPEARFEHDYDHGLSFRSVYCLSRNQLVIDRRYGKARVGAAIWDAIWPLKLGKFAISGARTLALLDYAVRARRWDAGPTASDVS